MTTAMRTVLTLLTAILVTFAIGTPQVAASVGVCTGNPCAADGDTTATCTPTTTGYTCACDSGFTSNGVTCAPQGPCSGKPDGTACNDGNACTQTDVCIAGACVGGNPKECTASDQCHTAGTCDPATGQCSNPTKTDGTACDDGDACTQADTCQAGVCVGSNPVVCNDQCRTGATCDPATGQCSGGTPVADGTACDDGDPCTTGDVCQSGTCTAGTVTPEACVDHFKCYTTSRVSPPKVGKSVTLTDEFETNKTDEVSTVATICNPVDKNGEGILHSQVHLVCYHIKDAPPPFAGANVEVDNQFGQETMHVNRATMLCVPSTKQVLP